MLQHRTVLAAACLALALSYSCASPSGPAATAPAQGQSAQAINQSLSPGVNYGNVFEANPPEGWGIQAKEVDFALMARAGFKSVRLPVRWSAKAAATAPYTIDPAFFNKVDRMVYAGLKAGMKVMVNMHHYDELFKDPGAHRARFLALWEQIAAHYSRHPSGLLLEILNEPHDKLDAGLWNGLYPQALAVIRKHNPTRVVLIGTADYGGAAGLEKLVPPSNDPNIIVTFHHYAPFEFTHQGAEWVGGQSKAWLGRQCCDGKYLAMMTEDFNKARNFARRYKVPVNMGEYGAYSKADMPSRVRWTAAMSDLAIRYGFSRHYWEFKSGFGLYDEKAGRWNEELKAAALK